MHMNKVTIIGTGSVGSTIAYTMAVNGIASEIVMVDINEEKALGEALDIRQGTPFCAPVSIYAGSYRDAANSDIVIVTSGIARKPGQSRLDLAQTNVNITKKIIPEVTRHAPDATYIIVSNPVDILTYVFNKVSGLPESKIIGSGTILDTARLRSASTATVRLCRGLLPIFQTFRSTIIRTPFPIVRAFIRRLTMRRLKPISANPAAELSSARARRSMRSLFRYVISANACSAALTPQ